MIKSFLWTVFLAFGLQASWGFALLGPLPGYAGLPSPYGDEWETQPIDYGFGDVGGPKNLGEEYRRNTPVLYYACDANFLDYFGSNGMAAVESACAILNGLTNVDSYSPDLSEFPLNSQSVNYTAQSLGLSDLKSWVMALLLEQLGLAEPERYTWTLHTRYQLPVGTCPFNIEYLVVQRNFNYMPTAPNQMQYSSYVNDTLYSYYIQEYCQPPNPLSLTIPFSVDPMADTFTAVAGLLDGLSSGGFYTGLTRDDVGGLRYLLSTNNANTESTAPGSVLTSSSSGTTNYGPSYVLTTSNYTAFALAALTNDPATLANLFPGLVVSSSLTNWVTVPVPNVVATYVPNGSYGNPPSLVVTTNGWTTNIVEEYVDTFANLTVLTNGFQTNSGAQLMTIKVTPNGSYGNGVVTNTSFQPITLANVPSGNYYIMTNPCGVNFVSPQPPGFPVASVVATTNLIVTASNSAGYFYSQSIVSYATNLSFIVQPLICASGGTIGTSNAVGLYQGVGRIQFVWAPYDSLIGQTWQPITNNYTMTVIGNSQSQRQTFQRYLTGPDIIFSAQDEAAPNPPSVNVNVGGVDRNAQFDVTHILPNLAGPGTIIATPPAVISFDKVGDIYLNSWANLVTNQFLIGPDEFTQSGDLLAFGSFDSSTNDPVVYPNGTSIQNLENELTVQLSIAPSLSGLTLLNGTNGQPYTATTITATGGAFNPPFTWSAAGLPPGLTLTTTNSVGTISGTPTQSGTFDFTLQLSDVLTPPRTVAWPVVITIK